MNRTLPYTAKWFTLPRPAAVALALAAGLALAVALLAAPSALHAAPAANICVGTGETHTTIQGAVNAANPGDNLFVKSQTFNEHVVITKSLSLYGGYTGGGCGGVRTPRNSIVDGGASGVVFSVTGDNINVVIDGFTIRNAASQGIYSSSDRDTRLTVHDNLIRNNLGGGIYADYGARSVIRVGDNTIFNNSATNYGGLYAYAELSSTVVINNNQIVSNSVTGSYAGAYAEVENGSRLEVTSNAVLTNVAGSQYGGGYFYWYTGGTGAFDDNLVQGNRATVSSYGGVYVYAYAGSQITFHDNRILNNQATNQFGGFYLDVENNSRAIGSNLRVEGNQSGSSYGGGYVYAYQNSQIELPDTQILGNSAATNYGGVYFDADYHSRVDAPNAYFYNNSANSYGGGALSATDYNDVVYAPNTQVISNTARSGSGGGLRLDTGYGSTLDVTGLIVRLNKAQGNSPSGGGAYVDDVEYGSQLLISNAIFESNAVSATTNGAYGGGLYVSSGPQYGGFLDLRNAQFLTNTARGATSSVEGGGLYLGEQYYSMQPDFTYTSTLLSGAVFRANLATGPSSVSGAGAYFDTFEEGAAVDLQNSVFASNVASSTTGTTQGGGVYLDSIYEGAGIRLDGSVFASNVVTTTGTGEGGAFYSNTCYSGCLFSYQGGSVTNNLASDDGGGIWMYYVEYGSYGYFEDLLFNGNRSLTGDGGAFYVDDSLAYDGSYASFQRNTVTNNRAGSDGGGIYIAYLAYDGGYAQVNDNTFSNNIAGGGGGGAYFSDDTSYDGSRVEFLRNTVTNNRAEGGPGGGVVFDDVQYGSSLWIGDNTVTGNVISSTSGYDGGGLYFFDASFSGTIYEGSTLTVTNNLIADNRSTNYGGGIYLSDGIDYGSIGYFANNDLLRNVAGDNYGGGCYLGDLYYGSVMTFRDNRVNDNVAEYDGGGCYFEGFFDGSALYADGNEFNGNTSGADYGGLNIYDSGTGAWVEFTHNDVIGNRAGITNSVVLAGGGYAGAYFYNIDSYLTVSHNRVLSNTANVDTLGNEGDYAGLYVYNDGIAFVTDNLIQGNAASGDYGGLTIVSGNSGLANVDDNRILNNSAAGQTGGVYLPGGAPDPGMIVLRRNTISGNSISGSGFGPAILVENNPSYDPLDYWVGSENNLIAGNPDGGVGVSDANWHGRNDTVADNGAFGYAYTGTVTTTVQIINTIVWGNTADFSDFSLTVTPVFAATYSILANGTLAEPTNLSTDPLFAPGGYYLQAGSPAVDSALTAAAPPDDHDGRPRPFGVAADRGAFEYVLLRFFLPLVLR